MFNNACILSPEFTKSDALMLCMLAHASIMWWLTSPLSHGCYLLPQIFAGKLEARIGTRQAKEVDLQYFQAPQALNLRVEQFFNFYFILQSPFSEHFKQKQAYKKNCHVWLSSTVVMPHPHWSLHHCWHCKAPNLQWTLNGEAICNTDVLTGEHVEAKVCNLMAIQVSLFMQAQEWSGLAAHLAQVLKSEHADL